MALTPLPILEDTTAHEKISHSPFPPLGMMPMPAEIPPTTAVAATSAEELRMQELERMLQEAQGRAELMEREAYDKAYATGEKAGMALGEKRAEQTLESLALFVGQAEEKLKGLEEVCAEAALDIAQAVVQHVLGGMDEQRHAMLFSAVEKAALQFPDLSGLKLLVHPEDLQVFEGLLDASKFEGWRIKASHEVEVGCCRLLSHQQDIQIDPHAAVQQSIDALRVRLQSPVQD